MEEVRPCLGRPPLRENPVKTEAGNRATRRGPSALSLGTGAAELVSNWLDEESGSSAVEYGLLLALIAMVVIFGITTFGTTVNTNLFTLAATIFPG